MTKLVNCTPHAVMLHLADGFIIGIEPSGIIARAKQTNVKVGELKLEGSSIPIVKAEYGEVTDLPEPQEDTLYIVSGLTAAAAPSRTDLVGTTDLVRDDEGRIIGCKALCVYNQ